MSADRHAVLNRPPSFSSLLLVRQPQLTLCVPITSSTSCDQVIFVDHAIDVSLSSDAAQVEVDRVG